MGKAGLLKAIRALDGVAVVNIEEPSDGDLERINDAYHATLKELEKWKGMAERLFASLAIARRDLQSVRNIDPNKLGNLAQAALDDTAPVIAEYEKLKQAEEK